MRIHPNSSLGVKMGDGHVYMPDRNGLIEVSDRHAREINTSYNKKHLDLFSDPVGGAVVSSDPGLICESCSFIGWSWQEKCPSGHKLKGD